MILVRFLNDKLQVFDNVENAVDAIDRENIHPDLLKIFHGNFEEIQYRDLLKMNNFFLDLKKIENETYSIVNNIQQKLKDKTDDDFLISSIVYPYGSVREHIFLKTGFNPLLLVSVNFGVLNPKIDTRKLRSIAINSVENGWDVIKVRQDQNSKDPFIYGNHPSIPYSIFITKHRDKLRV